jgi:hypothetical protein
MNSFQIEKNIQSVVTDFSPEEFVFDLLLAYGIPKATVTLLKKGRHNLSQKEGQIILKKKLFFQEVKNGQDLHETIDTLQKDKQTLWHNPRFIIVTDYANLLAVDTKTKEHLEKPIGELAKRYDFFLPWAGIEKHKHTNENPADRKAAEKMAKLYDLILKENDIADEEKTRDLNIFLSRLLFCFFAEDTGIFDEGLFTDSVASHTQTNGSDLDKYLEKLFAVLNTKEQDRAELPDHFRRFPYVNGGLFRSQHWIPQFSAKSRAIIVECGTLNWKEINPDIFGSMMQAVTHPGQRASLGMHYTSVPNIMKVIEPLFLNNLREAFEKSKGNKKKLNNLLWRISRIKLFDPACGSGNFLIIAYKELRRLQIAILQEMNSMAYPRINLSQFYGIEIDDFAHTIAKLSLYLAEHQMNIEFKEVFGKVEPTLPLRESGRIVCGNATRLNWEEVCPKRDGDEIYVLGNPPYLGYSMQSLEQKEDLQFLFKEFGNYKSLDYISCWFIKGAEYIRGSKVKLAFVSTNSVCQGEQVALLWPHVLGKELEIGFAHTSFKWSNNAKKNAGVTVIVLGLRNISKEQKFLFRDNQLVSVTNINPYLIDGENVFVAKRNASLSKLPEMLRGNGPVDGGYLLFTKEEKDRLVEKNPDAVQFLKKVIGSAEFIKGIERWCLWIEDGERELAERVEGIKQRIDLVKKFREQSKKKATREDAKTPHKFSEIRYITKDSIIIPRHSSERREYIPFGYLTDQEVILDSAQAIYDAEPWIFGVISSRMHMVWVRAVCGSLETRIRYSSALGYNTFPIPTLTTKQKEELTRHVYTVLEERERHPEKTMADLYDPDKMPEGLREAHHSLDLAVDRIYRSKPFTTDEERLEHLFTLYERMANEEKS